MPGIVGLITKMPRQRAESQLRQMVDSIRHESFYETGTWCDESLGVYVGWAARTGSFGSGMPVFNGRKDVSLVFSGEEYPANAADGPGYLVRAYENDPSFPAGLNGRFHGLVVDRTQRTAL